MAREMKDQDYDFLEVLDENEEIEGMYEEMARDRERDQMVINEQREYIERLQADVEFMRFKQEERDRELNEKDLLIETLNQKLKKRSREDFEAA